LILALERPASDSQQSDDSELVCWSAGYRCLQTRGQIMQTIIHTFQKPSVDSNGTFPSPSIEF